MTDTTDDFTPASEQEEQDDLTAIVPPVERWTPPPVPPNWQPPAQQPPVQPPMTVIPRQSVLYVIASFFIPGLGSMMNGQVLKGVIFLVVALISIPLILLFGLGIITSIIVRIWACVAAHTDTQAWNKAHGFIS